MPDREKVIKALEAHGCGKSMWRVCSICEYDKDECINDRCRDNLLTDAYALLKEQEELLHKKQKDIDRLCAEISELKHKIHDDVPKEQEAVKPINSYGTFRCRKCKNIVGYNDGDGRGYQNNFCSKCGQAVKWQ